MMKNTSTKFVHKKRGEDMNKVAYLMTADDVAAELNCSKGYAYKVIHGLNKELEQKGYLVIAGKIPKAYWAKKFYGYQYKA